MPTNCAASKTIASVSNHALYRAAGARCVAAALLLAYGRCMDAMKHQWINRSDCHFTYMQPCVM